MYFWLISFSGIARESLVLENKLKTFQAKGNSLTKGRHLIIGA